MTPLAHVKEVAIKLGATFDRAYTKRVSFSDLARGEAWFIYIDGIRWTNENCWDELKAAASAVGLILSE